jgi:long-subunit fatty acid transport protein
MINIDIFSNCHKARTAATRIALLLSIVSAVAQSGLERNGVGTRAIALANAYVAIADDAWAVYYNPAGLARISSVQVSAFFSPAQFGMKELRTVSGGATFPLSFCTGGVVIDGFGCDLYRETSLSCAFGTIVINGISLGATAHFGRITIEGYGSASRLIFDAGGIATVTDDVCVGWCWKNVTQTVVGANWERLPQIMSMGVCYEITEHSRLAVELEKDIRYPIIKKFSFEQQLLDAISVRLGISDNPDKFSCGLGFRVGGIEFSYAGYSHPQLGWTHQVELSVSFSR